jgi:hypothetical protein
MNRLAGIILAAVGLIVSVVSILQILPGFTGAGVALILGGGLVIGLSFVNGPESSDGERMSTPATLANIFLSPTEVFKNLRTYPRFLVGLIVIVLLGTIYTNLFFNRLGPDTIVNYTIDKTLEMSMIANNEEAKKQVEAGRPQALLDARSVDRRAAQAANSFVGTLFVNVIGAAIFLVLALAMGGKLNFFQGLSIFVYAGFPVYVIRFLLNTLLLYLKDPSDIHPILGQQSLIQDSLNFLVKSAEHPVLYSFLTSFSLLGIYWVWLLATGFKNAGEKVTGTIAWTGAIGVYTALMLLGVVLALLFPSFMS